MRKNALYISVITLSLFLCGSAFATSVDEQIKIVADQVAELKLGFGEYILGSSLSDSQKHLSESTRLDKATKGTYKFKDEELFVVASQSDDTILGLYKEYPGADKEAVKTIIGELMLNHGEPTAMAHSKLVYWTYNTSGKISQDDFDFSRQSGGTDSLVTVKLSSSERIVMQEAEDKEEKFETSDMYVMITSDPLSKLFLAKNSVMKESE